MTGPAFEPRRLPPAWRWTGVAARAVHLVAVVLLGAALLGAPAGARASWAGAALLATGAVMFALEQWKTREHVFQLAGAGQVAKLAAVAWMIGDPARAAPLYWLIVVWSAVFAHAPAGFRHTDLRRRLGLRR